MANQSDALESTRDCEREEYAICTENLVKVFPGTVALKGVDIKFKKGTVIGLLGKNGSGKSTLVNVLGGMLKKTSGKVFYEGNEEQVRSVSDSENLGFRFISQEPYLMDDLTVAENIAFREKHLKKQFGYVNRNSINLKAKEKLSKINLTLDPSMQTKFLRVSEKQLILAVREVLSDGAKVVAFDEVANALSQSEIECVFDLIRKEKENGVTFIYISHEIDEVFSICDSVVVIRDGEVVLEGEINDLTSSQLKRAIAGRDIDEMQTGVNAPKYEETVLSVKDLCNCKLKNVSFDLKKGEILGVYGLRGAGRTELLKTIYGLMDATSGSVKFEETEILRMNINKRTEMGIGFVPESRAEGCMDCRPIRDNLFISSMKQNLNKLKLIDRSKENKKYEQIKKEFEVKAESLDNEIGYLSGGNKQKIMFARCKAMDSTLYLVDEGTKGIDVGTKFEIYNLMEQLADNGDSFVYTSSDLDEICTVSHRIIVLYNGEIVAELEKKEFKKELLLHHADGNRQ